MVYVPTWPGLGPSEWLAPRSHSAPPFPFHASNQQYYYRARNALFHLCRTLRRTGEDWALVPDYHHGNEISAIRAAGFGVRFYPVRRDLSVDLDALAAACRDRPRMLLSIHYLGWPQPMDAVLALCREFGIVSIEDCALALLSEDERGVPLGSRADYAIFCLYKTLPVPNGGLLVRRHDLPDPGVPAASVACGVTSLAARTVELAIERIRGEHERVGAPIAALKQHIGRLLTRAEVRRWPVGDSGFDLAAAQLRMSRVSHHLLDHLDYERIRTRRRENFERLGTLLEGRAKPLLTSLPAGVCPLFFPLLVPDKAEAAHALWDRGIGAVEFWNEGDAGARGSEHSGALFLRRHVLELPVHQDLRPEQLAYMADEVARLGLQHVAA